MSWLGDLLGTVNPYSQPGAGAGLGPQQPPDAPEPSNWMHALNLLGATLKDYSNHGRSNNIALTQDAIQKHKEATARLAPYVPPDILGPMYVARLNGDYDPAAGKYAIPGLGIYSRDTQSRFPSDGMPFMPPRGFGNNNPVLARTIPPARRAAARNPMPDISGSPFQSPFVRAAFAALAASQARERPVAQSARPAPTAYAADHSKGSPYGGTLTPIARVNTPGEHTSDHDPDEWQDPNRPMDATNVHPKWDRYDRRDAGPFGFGFWRTDEDDWEYSTDGGKIWHQVEPGMDNFRYRDPTVLVPNQNDNPQGHIFRKKRRPEF